MASPRQPCNHPFYAFYQVPVEHFALWAPGPFTSGCFPYSLFLHYSSLHFSHVVGVHWLLTFPPIFTSSTWVSSSNALTLWGLSKPGTLKPTFSTSWLTYIHPAIEASSISVQATFSVLHDYKHSFLPEWEKWDGTFGHQRNYLNWTEKTRWFQQPLDAVHRSGGQKMWCVHFCR